MRAVRHTAVSREYATARKPGAPMSLSSVIRLPISAPYCPLHSVLLALRQPSSYDVLCFSRCSAFDNQQLLTSPRIRPFPVGQVLWPLLTSRRPFACHHAALSPSATQCSCSVCKTSMDKHNHFHTIHPPHLRLTPRAVSDFALFGSSSGVNRLICDFCS